MHFENRIIKNLDKNGLVLNSSCVQIRLQYDKLGHLIKEYYKQFQTLFFSLTIFSQMYHFSRLGFEGKEYSILQ